MIDLLNDNTPLYPPWGRFAISALMLVAAWLVSRAAEVLARHLLVWRQARRARLCPDDTGEIANLKRQETAISIVRGAVSTVAFATATFLVAAQFTGGVDRLKTALGASFVLLLAAFSMQRLLHDVAAGGAIFLERWYSVGDTVVLHPDKHQGVVEDISLRRTKLRSLSGEVIHVPNAQINAARILPRGLTRLAVELHVSDREQGQAAFDAAARLLPLGPTLVAAPPRIDEIDQLSGSRVRLRSYVAVVPGREWLIEEFFVELLRTQTGDVLLHDPLVLHADDDALASYSRLSSSASAQQSGDGTGQVGAHVVARMPRQHAGLANRSALDRLD